MARKVLTARDLEGLADGGEIALTPDTIVTALAEEEAARRKIVIRVVERSAADGKPDGRTSGADFSHGRAVAVGADHGGYELKELLKHYLREWGYAPLDLGTHGLESVDYPDFAEAVACAVAKGQAWRGVVIDSAGIGSSIAANKVPGVRAALCYDRATARNSREHNDANILSLGAKLISPELAREILAVWLETPFSGGRHERRVEKIRAIEGRHRKA